MHFRCTAKDTVKNSLYIIQNCRTIRRKERKGANLKGRDHFLTLNFSSNHTGSLRRGNTAMTWAISALIS